MSPPALPVVLKAFEAAMKRDFAAFRESLSPDCVMSTTYPSTLPFGGDSKGSEAVADHLRRIAEPFDVLGADMKDMLSQGETIVLVYDEKIRAKATQKNGVNRAVAVVKVAGDRIASIQLFADAHTVMGLL